MMEEALHRANQAVEDLNALGLNYRVVTGAASENKGAGKRPSESGGSGADKKRSATGFCLIQ